MSTEPPTVTPTAAHHRPDGGFKNPWPDAELHGFKDVARWKFGDKRPKTIQPSPPYGSLPTRRSEVIASRAQPGYRSATWVGHSTVLLQLGKLNVLTDPVWSERASPFQWIGPRRLMPPALDFDALPPIDVVLLSHNHYDHLDATTVRRIAKRFPGAAWLCPLRLGKLLTSLGVPYIIERDWWQPVETPEFSANCVPAQHFSARGVRDRGDTLWCGWTIDADDVCVYFAGDTALHPEFAAIGARTGPFDLVMLPIGAYDPRWFMRSVHMDPDDAMAAYRALTSHQKTTPPCMTLHWGTFRLTDEPVEEPPARFAKLWRDAGFSAEWNWTFQHGETKKL